MTKHLSSFAVVLVVATTIVFTACGGGGSPSSPTPVPFENPNPLPQGAVLIGSLAGYILDPYDPTNPNVGVAISIPKTEDGLNLLIKTERSSSDPANLLVTVFDRLFNQVGAIKLSEVALSLQEKKGEILISHQGSRCVGNMGATIVCDILIQNRSSVVVSSPPGMGVQIYSVPSQ